MRKQKTASLMVATLFGASTAFAVGFTDSFGGPGINPGWITDRYEPAGFSSVGGRLEIDISDADSAANRPAGYSSIFYNTQGRQREALVSGLWTLSGEIEVGSDVTGNNLRRADLWGRTGAVGTETDAEYFILGYRNFDPLDPFNSSSASIGSAWRVWDGDTVNGWVDIGTSVTAGWHDVSISYTGSSILYQLDGVPVYTDTTLGTLTADFTTAYAQAYNFDAGDYTARFDNINVSVPEAGATSPLLATGLGFIGLLGFFKNRRE